MFPKATKRIFRFDLAHGTMKHQNVDCIFNRSMQTNRSDADHSNTRRAKNRVCFQMRHLVFKTASSCLHHHVLGSTMPSQIPVLLLVSAHIGPFLNDEVQEALQNKVRMEEKHC
jgi:hypothetical protein